MMFGFIKALFGKRSEFDDYFLSRSKEEQAAILKLGESLQMERVDLERHIADYESSLMSVQEHCKARLVSSDGC